MKMREDEAFRLFADLIRIPSVTATEGEEEICAYLEQALQACGAKTRRIAKTPERPNLLAEIRASHPSQPPLVLISHVDVVPAEADKWSHPPFSAEEADGRIWGRGTLDTKHLTAMELFAFVHLLGHEAEMNRDVRFLATIDEEQGSEYGMGYVRQTNPELFEGAVVINEGGGFPLRINGRDYMMLTVGEKAVCRVRLRAEGTAGHASAPTEDQAMLKLAEGLKRVFENEEELCCGSLATRESMVGTVGSDEWDSAVGRDILGYAGVCSIGMRNYSIGVRSNVIPGTVEAVLEFKLLPYADEGEVKRYLDRHLRGTQVTWKMIGCEAGFESNKENSRLDEVTEILSEACRHNGFEGEVLPMLALGRTDGRFFAGTGSVVYGFSPVTMGDSFDRILPKVHGTDESILSSSFRFGLRVLDETIGKICGVWPRDSAREAAL